MTIERLAATAQAFALPLRSRFRSTDIRHGALFEGPSGWAEFAPFVEYSDHIAGRWLAAALEQAFDSWPQQMRSQIPINAIIPLLDPTATYEHVVQAVTDFGMTTIKLKVDDGLPDSHVRDVARVKAARAALTDLGVNGRIRIDVNGAWSPQDASHRLAELDDAAVGLDYVEQPCATVHELGQLRDLLADSYIKIAVDESIRLSEQLDGRALRDVADIAIIKSIPIGGVRAALAVTELVGLPIVVSGSLDTSVGLASGLALAASVPALYGACGLGTGLLFSRDVTSKPLLPIAGELKVQRAVPDQDLNGTTELDSQWRQRMIRAWHASAIHLVTSSVREAVESW